MKNKLFYIFLFAFGFCVNSFSQEDFNKQLLNHHWICKGSFSETTLVFTKKTETKSSPVEMRFLPSGRILRCDSIHETSSDYEGNIHKTDNIGCDSTAIYSVKKDMIRISRASSKSWYYKAVSKNNGYELNSISSEEYNKK